MVANNSPRTYTLESIEKVASDLHRDYADQNSLITIGQLKNLAESIGAKVELVVFKPDTVSARVLGGDGSYKIQISDNEPMQRQKFSLAHEIGHIILHDVDKEKEKEFIEYRKPILDYADSSLLYKETQANAFAAALLIPKEDAINVWDSVKDIDDFAEIFEVSKAAAYNRLSNLGLLEF